MSKPLVFPKKLTIEVTAEDIRLGKPEDACKCPIARASKRAMKGTSPYVDGDLIYMHTGDTVFFPRSYSLPKKAKDFVLKFDGYKKGKIAPMTFQATLEAHV